MVTHLWQGGFSPGATDKHNRELQLNLVVSQQLTNKLTDMGIAKGYGNHSRGHSSVLKPINVSSGSLLIEFLHVIS